MQSVLQRVSLVCGILAGLATIFSFVLRLPDPLNYSLAVITVVVLAVSILWNRIVPERDQNRITFSIERFQRDKQWFVRIQQPDKLISRLNVICDDSPCFLKDPPTKIPQTEINLRLGGGVNFKMPEKVDLESKIKVRNGTHVIERRLFHEIPPAAE